MKSFSSPKRLSRCQSWNGRWSI